MENTTLNNQTVESDTMAVSETQPGIKEDDTLQNQAILRRYNLFFKIYGGALILVVIFMFVAYFFALALVDQTPAGLGLIPIILLATCVIGVLTLPILVLLPFYLAKRKKVASRNDHARVITLPLALFVIFVLFILMIVGYVLSVQYLPFSE
jgi:hypothetical protein